MTFFFERTDERLPWEAGGEGGRERGREGGRIQRCREVTVPVAALIRPSLRPDRTAFVLLL